MRGICAVQYEYYQMLDIDYYIKTAHKDRNWWEQQSVLKGNFLQIFLLLKKYTVVLFFLSPTNLPSQVLVITIDFPILLQRIFSSSTLTRTIPSSPIFILNFLFTLGWSSCAFVYYQEFLNYFRINCFYYIFAALIFF